MKSHKKNTSTPVTEFTPRVFLVQELTKIVTAVLLVLLALKGLLAFYGAKQSSWLEDVVTFITAPLVIPFQGLFTDTKEGEVPVFFSMLCVVFLAALVYTSAGLINKYSLWMKAQSKEPTLKTQNQN